MNWKQHYMRFFFCLSVSIFLSCAGYMIECLASNFESALVGTKVMYLGSSYVGLFSLLFAFEYINYSYKRATAILLALFPVTIMLLVFTWPLQLLYYSGLQFVQSDMGAYIRISPGPFYTPALIYNFSLALVALLCIMRHLMGLRMWKRRNTIIFTASIIIIAGIFLIRITRLIPEWFDPIQLMEVFALFMVTLHIRSFQQQEWHSIGRELAIENMKDAFILVDDNQSFLDANEVAMGYFPELRSFQSGTPLAQLGAVADTLLHDDNGDTALVLGEAEKRYLRISRSNLITKSKRFMGKAIMLYDNTERERLIIQLQEAQDHATSAEQATASKSAFLATMSHEIRTPMNAIIGMSDLAMREDLNPNARKYVVNIRQAGSNLLAIINDILDFSKIESGKLELIEAEYQVASLLNDCISIICMRIAERPLLFIANIDSSLPDRFVGDEVRVRQILINLLSNAVKYTKEGYILFTVSGAPVPGDEDKLIVTFTVSDSGVGIKETDLPKLFGEFNQFDTTANRSTEGTGLGLAISQNLCRLMGGEITVSSRYGEGSSFAAVIPQTTAPNATVLAVVHNPETKSSLLYEPQAMYADSLAWSLKNLKVPVTVANSPEELFQELETGTYSHVFIGSELADQAWELIQHRKLPTVPVLLVGLLELSASKSMFSLSMPAYAISIANVLNGVIQSSARDAATVRFIAPEARLLIVDDIVTNLTVAQGLLAQYQTQIDTCTSGKAAIELVKNNAYDIVFMDHMMPEMDGIEAATAIRSLDCDYVNTMPIIALTANAMSGMREVFLEKGLNDYLAKPIEIPKLNEIMERWIPRAKWQAPEEVEPVKSATATAAASVPNSAGAAPFPGDKLAGVEGMDIDDALRYAGNAKSLRVILEQFFEEAEDLIGAIKTSFAKKDWADYAIRTHAVKGVCAMIGMKSLSERAKELELAAKAGDYLKCEQDTISFCEAMAVFHQSLRKTPFMSENLAKSDAGGAKK
jgi:signal transduction histidine kinase/CheY-like chemotaxis protein